MDRRRCVSIQTSHLPGVRRENLLETWRQIVGLLEAQIQGVAAALPLPDATARGYEMKAYEDVLDAVVCAWVGACVLDGRATAFGDEDSAIWVPVRGSPVRGSPLLRLEK
ncbi:DUF429 domain-containing protein [Rhizobium johnstonii]|uniref:DUF429 domain-containing protein n=1 Tax=Rhizobium johnstonii TaxID=3019933 RepID=UPI003F97BAD9